MGELSSVSMEDALRRDTSAEVRRALENRQSLYLRSHHLMWLIRVILCTKRVISSVARAEFILTQSMSEPNFGLLFFWWLFLEKDSTNRCSPVLEDMDGDGVASFKTVSGR